MDRRNVLIVENLIALVRDNAPERLHRYGSAVVAEMALEAARRGRLRLLSPLWFHDFELDAQGAIHIRFGDPPSPESDRAPANALETNFVLFGAVRDFPELKPLLPQRPADATTCETCGGSGVPPWAAGQPNVACACAGAGWVLAGVDGMSRFPELG